MKTLFFLVFALLLNKLHAQDYVPKNYTLHFVERKESIWDVAGEHCKKDYGLVDFVKHIRRLNPGIVDNFNPGDEIKIPSSKRACLSKNWTWAVVLAAKGIKAIEEDGDEARINTRTYIEGVIGHDWFWTSKHRTRLTLHLAHEDYIENDRKLSNPAFIRTRVAVKHEYTPDNITYGLEAGVFQETVIRDSQSRDIELSVVNTPYLGPSFDYNIKVFKRNILKLGVAGNILFPAGDDYVKLKEGYEGRANIELITDKLSFQLFYLRGQHDSNFYENSYNMYGARYSVRFAGW